jgi:hypothetical protein
MLRIGMLVAKLPRAPTRARATILQLLKRMRVETLAKPRAIRFPAYHHGICCLRVVSTGELDRVALMHGDHPANRADTQARYRDTQADALPQFGFGFFPGEEI